ncbi:dehydrase and lipid transport-domain-containing protein [Aspergillus aurantiobrunneus]
MNRLFPSRYFSRLPKPSIRPESRHLSIYCNAPQSQQPRIIHERTPAQHLHHQKRTFLSSFIPSPPKPSNGRGSGNNAGGGNNNGRILTASRTLPYAPPPLFKVISSVESYAEFLPFLTASTVTARDQEMGYPTQAYLTVGYGPLSETFTSKVDCDAENGIVEARSGEKFVESGTGSGSGSGSGFGALAGLAGFPGADEGIFEYLRTRWELVPETGSGGGEARTTVKLEIRFEFKNQWYATMMSAVEGQMAGVMIEAFERRVREVNGG